MECPAHRSLFHFLLVLIFLFTISGCGGGQNAGSAVSPVPPEIRASSQPRSITLSWADVQEAAHYNLYWSAKPISTKSTATKIGDVRSPFTHNSLVAGGTYYYIVTSVSANGTESVESNVIMVQLPPGQNPTASLALPSSALLGQSVFVDGSGTSDADGTIANFSFEFGDGSPVVTLSSPSTSHVFTTRGTFPVTLTVTDDTGATSSITKEIVVGLVPEKSTNVSGSSVGLSQYFTAALDKAGDICVMWTRWGTLYFASSVNGGESFVQKKQWLSLIHISEPTRPY
jgi:PKD repeat protein